MKKSTKIYLLLSLLSVILIGLGCSVSLFEVSTYKTADYTTAVPDPNLPVIETSVETLEVSLTGDKPFKLDTYLGAFSNYKVQVDNTLQNKVLIQIDAPKNLYQFYLNEQSEQNHYTLDYSNRAFETLHLVLQLAKEGYFATDAPPFHITLVMNEAQAKNFKLNEERNRVTDITITYEDRIQTIEEEYQNQISDMQANYETTLTEQEQNLIDRQTEYENRLEELRAQYQVELDEKDARIEELQQQLENVRSSLN